MIFDVDNPVVKLCAAGMQAEGKGDHAEARRLFDQAWSVRTSDLDASIAAHYVARHAPHPGEALKWNQRALEHAERCDPEKIGAMLPSLYLNLAKSHEDLNELTEALRWYKRAHQVLDKLGDDRYGAIVRDAVTRGLERVASAKSY